MRSRFCLTAVVSEEYPTVTLISMRFRVSESVQLVRLLVMNCLFGMTISFLLKARRVEALILILSTVPETPLMVTMSPTRIGFSKRRMMPEMKFAKISWSPKPRPTERAATSHWSFSHSMPSALRHMKVPPAVIT